MKSFLNSKNIQDIKQVSINAETIQPYFLHDYFLKKSNLGPKIDKMTYTRDIIVVALSFGKKTIPDLPCKD